MCHLLGAFITPQNSVSLLFKSWWFDLGLQQSVAVGNDDRHLLQYFLSLYKQNDYLINRDHNRQIHRQ